MTEKINNIEKHLMENRQDKNARCPMFLHIAYLPQWHGILSHGTMLCGMAWTTARTLVDE